MFETVFLSIIAAAPSIVAIAGVIAAACKLLKSFKELKEEVTKTKEFEDLKDQLFIAHNENRELKKKLNELLTAMDRIKREE